MKAPSRNRMNRAGIAAKTHLIMKVTMDPNFICTSVTMTSLVSICFPSSVIPKIPLAGSTNGASLCSDSNLFDGFLRFAQPSRDRRVFCGSLLHDGGSEYR